MSRLNPEFRRYLWLELSPARLVAMPLVIAALMALVVAWTHEAGNPWGGRDLLEALSVAGSTGFALLMLFWGARLSANAVVREIAGRTWDQQRLGSAGAWAMTWGKLFGSTVFVWYGGAFFLAIGAVSLVLFEGAYGGVTGEGAGSPFALVLQLVGGLAAFGVLVTASVMLAAMSTVARRESGRQLDVSIAQIAVILLALLLFFNFGDLRYGEDIVWYGAGLDVSWFALASLVAFAAWSVAGLWRRMQVELQVRCLPVLWPLFALFTGFWLGGFAESATGVAVVVALVVLLAGYVPAALEPLDPVRLRRLFAAVGAREAMTALRFMPLWLVNHAVALVAVAVAALMLLSARGGSETGLAAEFDGHAIAAGTLVAFFLFVTRDLLLLMAAWLGRGGRRAFATWLLWMTLLYGLAPLLLSALGAYASLPAFVPLWDVPFAGFVVPPVVWPLLWVAGALALVRWRWRRYAASRVASEG